MNEVIETNDKANKERALELCCEYIEKSKKMMSDAILCISALENDDDIQECIAKVVSCFNVSIEFVVAAVNSHRNGCHACGECKNFGNKLPLKCAYRGVNHPACDDFEQREPIAAQIFKAQNHTAEAEKERREEMSVRKSCSNCKHNKMSICHFGNVIGGMPCKTTAMEYWELADAAKADLLHDAEPEHDAVNHPSHKNAKILILCGKSASGKDTIMKSLVNRGFCPIVSLTTRPIRTGEINGKDYEFISKADFMKLISDDKMIEYRSYATIVNGIPDEWFYGTAKAELDNSKIYVVILDLDGAKKVSEYYGKDNCIVAYVNAPENIRTKRAEARGSFDLTEWIRRLNSDNSAFSIENVHKFADIIVDNTGDLEKSVNEIIDFVEHHIDVNTNRPDKDHYYLGIAQAVAERSTCLRRQYGAVIVKNDEIIATGYNGAPRGEPNCCDTGECKRVGHKHNDGDYAECHSVHAEMNAIISAARSEMIGATLYLAGFQDGKLIQSEPCPVCRRMIQNAGITNVIGWFGYEE